MNDSENPGSSQRPSIFSAIRPLAALVGGMTDLMGTVFGGLVLVNVYAMARIFGGTLTREQVDMDGGRPFLEMYMADPSVLVVSLFMGFFMNALGGYVAARRAKSLPLIHGLLAGVASWVGGALLFDGDGADIPTWVLVFGYSFHLPAAIAGGWWFRRKQLV